ncbi:DUF4349 domain-containing protein [Methanocella conradii]|uniref:DUF4349 domain-containing protein n=1 Tax=Methanocella conradii TaxID=1175444 RepID=UPI00157C8032|nr:DUF4349 domain-containing protein [Methanocella conradii]
MKGHNGLKKGSIALAMLAVVSFVILSGCAGLMGGKSQPSYEGVVPTSPYDNSKSSFAAPVATTQPGNVYTNLSDRKVIMAASVQLEATEHDKAVNSIRGIAAGAGGYVESSSTWLTAQDKKQTTITIKVPAAQYEQCLSQIKALGKVKSESSSGQDVTRQYIDLSARLKNLQAEEKQLSDIMGMSKNVTEVLMVEKEFYRVRGEIESTQAQLNYLGSQVDFSTITVTVMEPQPVVEYDWGLDTAFKEGVRAFIGMIGALIVVTGYIIPLLLYFIIAAAIVYLIARAVWGFYRKKKEGK